MDVKNTSTPANEAELKSCEEAYIILLEKMQERPEAFWTEAGYDFSTICL